MAETTALIMGGGEGLSGSLARRFRAAGLAVAIAARRLENLQALFGDDPGIRPYRCDATDAGSVAALVEAVETEVGPIELAVHNPSAQMRKGFLELSPAEYEETWRTGPYGAFNLSQNVARRMIARGHGSIFFTGSSIQMRGGPRFGAMAPARAALRMMSQVMARELGPQGIHVAYVGVDGPIRSTRTLESTSDPEKLVGPDGIAEAYWFLHTQPRAAWTNELDVRPYSNWPSG